MNHRILTSMGGLVSALALLAPLPLAAQAPAATNVAAAASALARTPDGKPDLQGVWDFKTITPMERPRELGTKEFFTPAEAEAYAKKREQLENSQSKDDVHYDNVIWQSEKYAKVVTRSRTSIVGSAAVASSSLTSICDRSSTTWLVAWQLGQR